MGSDTTDKYDETELKQAAKEELAKAGIELDWPESEPKKDALDSPTKPTDPTKLSEWARFLRPSGPFATGVNVLWLFGISWGLV